MILEFYVQQSQSMSLSTSSSLRVPLIRRSHSSAGTIPDKSLSCKFICSESQKADKGEQSSIVPFLLTRTSDIQSDMSATLISTLLHDKGEAKLKRSANQLKTTHNIQTKENLLFQVSYKMSNQADLLYARDAEELEGALLPVATAVGQNDSNTTTSIATVIPSTETVFNYDTALQHEYQLQEEEAVAIPDNGSTLNYAGVADDSKTTVSRAQTAGKISSEEEIQSIRKANQKVFSHNYFEKQSFKAANARAKQRDRLL